MTLQSIDNTQGKIQGLPRDFYYVYGDSKVEVYFPWTEGKIYFKINGKFKEKPTANEVLLSTLKNQVVEDVTTEEVEI